MNEYSKTCYCCACGFPLKLCVHNKRARGFRPLIRRALLVFLFMCTRLPSVSPLANVIDEFIKSLNFVFFQLSPRNIFLYEYRCKLVSINGRLIQRSSKSSAPKINRIPLKRVSSSRNSFAGSRNPLNH